MLLPSLIGSSERSQFLWLVTSNNFESERSMSESEDKHDVKGQFESQATQSELGVIAEFIAFLKYNKKWWLTPSVVALLLIAILAISAGTGAAPFIYPLF